MMNDLIDVPDLSAQIGVIGEMLMLMTEYEIAYGADFWKLTPAEQRIRIMTRRLEAEMKSDGWFRPLRG